MIDDRGYPLLTDFEMSRSGTFINSKGFRGTIHYIAPDLFTEKIVDKSMDLWALGVCLYAMVTGNIPYETDQIYNKNFSKLCVKNEGNYQFNGAQVSEELIDLIHSLLKVNPKERLGYWNMDDLKSHSFFSKFDW